MQSFECIKNSRTPFYVKTKNFLNFFRPSDHKIKLFFIIKLFYFLFFLPRLYIADSRLKHAPLDAFNYLKLMSSACIAATMARKEGFIQRDNKVGMAGVAI